MIFELLHTNEPDHPCSHLLYSFKIEEQKKNGYAKIKIIKAQMIREGKYTSRDEDYVMEELARDHITRSEFRADMKELLERFDRIEAKLDTLRSKQSAGQV